MLKGEDNPPLQAPRYTDKSHTNFGNGYQIQANIYAEPQRQNGAIISGKNPDKNNDYWDTTILSTQSYSKDTAILTRDTTILQKLQRRYLNPSNCLPARIPQSFQLAKITPKCIIAHPSVLGRQSRLELQK